MKRLVLGLVVVVAAAAALLFWRERSRPRQTPLEPAWTAVTAVVAGDGTAGARDGDAMHARFSDPFGVAAAADGTIYVADAGTAQRIRRIAPDGTVSSVAGSEEGFADGRAAAARFSTPSGIALGPNGVLYVADTGNNKIRRMTPDGDVTTVAGVLTAGYADGDPQQAQFNGPVGVAIDPAGRVIVADTYNDRIRAIEPGGSVVTLAGTGQPGAVDGPAAAAQFDTPCGVATDRAGNIYVADTGNGLVRMISAAGAVSTLGPTSGLTLVRPIGLAVSDSGVVYVTDDRGRIVEIDPSAGTRTLAGSRPGFADGTGEEARFRSLSGLALAAPGRLVVTDSRNALIRVVAARARLELRPPVSPLSAPHFDPDAFGGPLLWPIDPMDGPFEVTGTLGEARGAEGTERFHAGVDVHAPDGTIVRAVRRGTVVGPAAVAEFGTLNESVRIGPIAYVHVRVGRRRDGIMDATRFVPSYDDAGHLARVRVRRGAHFAVGDSVGTTNGFNHVHLNVGWPGEEYNPLQFRLVQFVDTVRPTIARGGIRVLDEWGRQLKERRKGRLVVSGRVQVVVDAWDQVDGSQRRRRLGVYRLGYQVLNRDGSPAPGFEMPRETIRFDKLALEGDFRLKAEATEAEATKAEGTKAEATSAEPASAARIVYASGSGIPFYGSRTTHFLYVVTNRFRDGVASADTWDTSLLPPGDYILRVLAADREGNEANRDLAITIPQL